jgi:hypothetical protein
MSFTAITLLGASLATAGVKEELREQLQAMEQKAKALKEAGKMDEFEAVKQAMKDLMTKAKEQHAAEMKAAKEGEAKEKSKKADSEEPEGKEKKKGDDGEERERKKKLHQEEMEKMEHKKHEEIKAREEKEGDRREAEKDGDEQRMQRLRAAAEHLRAAGHEELAKQILQAPQKPRHDKPKDAVSPELAERIGRQFQEMQHALRQLNERLERLEKAAKDKH